MPVCLEAEYESVIDTLGAYAIYAARIRSRMLFDVRTLYRLLNLRPELPEQQPEAPEHQLEISEEWETANLFFRMRLIPNWPGLTPALKKLIQQCTTKEEQSSPFFDVILSNYPLETLALQIEAKQPDVNFAQVANLHEFRDKRFWRAKPRVLITGILSVGLFFLNTIPDPLIRTFGIEFPAHIVPAEGFDVIVFVITMASVLLIFGIWLTYWMEIGRGQRKIMKGIRDALGYLAIRQARSLNQSDAAADPP